MPLGSGIPSHFSFFSCFSVLKKKTLKNLLHCWQMCDGFVCVCVCVCVWWTAVAHDDPHRIHALVSGPVSHTQGKSWGGGLGVLLALKARSCNFTDSPKLSPEAAPYPSPPAHLVLWGQVSLEVGSRWDGRSRVHSSETIGVQTGKALSGCSAGVNQLDQSPLSKWGLNGPLKAGGTWAQPLIAGIQPPGVQPRWVQGIRSGDGVGEDQEITA